MTSRPPRRCVPVPITVVAVLTRVSCRLHPAQELRHGVFQDVLDMSLNLPLGRKSSRASHSGLDCRQCLVFTSLGPKAKSQFTERLHSILQLHTLWRHLRDQLKHPVVGQYCDGLGNTCQFDRLDSSEWTVESLSYWVCPSALYSRRQLTMISFIAGNLFVAKSCIHCSSFA